MLGSQCLVQEHLCVENQKGPVAPEVVLAAPEHLLGFSFVRVLEKICKVSLDYTSCFFRRLFLA